MGLKGGYSLFQRDSLTLNRVTFPITVWTPAEIQTVTEVCGAESHLPWFWNSTENHYIIIKHTKTTYSLHFTTMRMPITQFSVRKFNPKMAGY